MFYDQTLFYLCSLTENTGSKFDIQVQLNTREKVED